MTNINEVTDRLSGLVAEPDLCREPLNVIKDLKALLSYTKQFREALSEIAACEVRYPGDLVSVARRALSTQPGERE